MQVPNKNYKDVNQKRLVRWVLLVLVWGLILSVSRSFTQTRRGFLRLDEAAVRLDQVKKENDDLRLKLEMVSSEDHKVKIMRDKLRMQKSDEVVVVMPFDSHTISQESEHREKAIWNKWLDLVI